MKKKIIGIFLDRDGVLNYDCGPNYYSNPKKLLPGVIVALKRLNKIRHLIKVIIITNQSAVAKGYISENNLKKSLKDLLNFFKSKNIIIDDIFYCPFHPKIGNSKYKKDSYLRKPKPGMFFKAKAKHNINLKKSFMIGNSLADYKAAIASNVFPLVINNNRIKIKKKYKFHKIKKAINFIINEILFHNKINISQKL
jgi:D,D-heptose 1,7-bisphosphate phosphatase